MSQENNFRHTTIIVLLVLLLLVNAFALWRESNQSPSFQPHALLIQNASQATIKDQNLTMHGIFNNLFFTEAPFENSGDLSKEQAFVLLQQRLENSPRNAFFKAKNKDRHVEGVCSLLAVEKKDETTFIYTITALRWFENEEHTDTDFEDAWLIIDPIGLSFSSEINSQITDAITGHYDFCTTAA